MGVYLILLMCVLFCGSGLMLVFAKDSAWNYVSWRNRNGGLASERTDQWNTSATIQGVILIVLGLGSLFLLPLTARHSPAPAPQAGDVIISIPGRTLTPQQQEELQHESGAFKGLPK